MVKENIIPIENKKPAETVYELKNEIPTFEEFMKSYKSDGNLNYDDLSGGVGKSKRYGPCNTTDCRYPQVGFDVTINYGNSGLRLVIDQWNGPDYYLSSVGEVIILLEAFRDRTAEVLGSTGEESVRLSASARKTELVSKLEECVNRHLNGESINLLITDTSSLPAINVLETTNEENEEFTQRSGLLGKSKPMKLQKQPKSTAQSNAPEQVAPSDPKYGVHLPSNAPEQHE